MPKLVCAFMALIGLALAGPASAQPQRMVIATAGTAGALYPMGVSLAETINRHSQSLKASAEASAASLENLRNLAQGEVDWGISQNEVAYLAYQGQGRYQDRPIKDLRSLFGTIISWVQIFVPADSGINSVADLKGKRLGVGPPGSGGEMAASLVLAFHGLDYKSVRAEFMGNVDMVSALKDGSLDGFIITHPLRSAPLLDLTSTMKVRMLPVADQSFYQKHPYYTRREIPAGAYPGQEQAVATPTSRIVMYALAGRQSPQTVYDLLTIVWGQADSWTGCHPAVKKSTSLAAALDGLAVPLHPGALRYYREKGLTVPSRLAGE